MATDDDESDAEGDDETAEPRKKKLVIDNYAFEVSVSFIFRTLQLFFI